MKIQISVMPQRTQKKRTGGDMMRKIYTYIFKEYFFSDFSLFLHEYMPCLQKPEEGWSDKQL